VAKITHLENLYCHIDFGVNGAAMSCYLKKISLLSRVQSNCFLRSSTKSVRYEVLIVC
jgi:hypothetical protein